MATVAKANMCKIWTFLNRYVFNKNLWQTDRRTLAIVESLSQLKMEKEQKLVKNTFKKWQWEQEWRGTEERTRRSRDQYASMDPNLVSPFHNDPSDGDALTSGLHPDLCHQTTDEHDEEKDEQIHFVNVYRAKIN